MKRLFSALLSVALLLTLLPAAEAKSGAWDGSVASDWFARSWINSCRNR